MNAVHTQYPDFANPELLDKIPLTARTILDVGCAQGALGADYLRRNPACRVLGIEMDETAAAHARQRLSEVFVGDVEKPPMPFEVPDGIDCTCNPSSWPLGRRHCARRHLLSSGTRFGRCR